MSEKIEQYIVKIFDKLEILNKDVAVVKNKVENIEEDVKKNTKDLEEHIAGVITNQERLNVEVGNREKLEETVTSIKNRVSEMEKVHTWFTMTLKALGIIALILGVIGGFLRYIWPLFLV